MSLKDLSPLQIAGIVIVLGVVLVAFVLPKGFFPCQCASCAAETALKNMKLQTVVIDGQEVVIPLEVQGDGSVLTAKSLLSTLLALACCAIVLGYLYGKAEQSGLLGQTVGRLGRYSSRSGL